MGTKRRWQFWYSRSMIAAISMLAAQTTWQFGVIVAVFTFRATTLPQDGKGLIQIDLDQYNHQNDAQLRGSLW